MRTLTDVVAFFNRGGAPSGTIGKKEIVALNLTLDEEADLVAFMKTLTGPGLRLSSSRLLLIRKDRSNAHAAGQSPLRAPRVSWTDQR
jgi:hypothetical protein